MTTFEVPFDLVEAKLAAPFARSDTVAKADLIARLCTARMPLASVVAPAGYGKTTLLARWAEADPRPFAWVAVDRLDDDYVVFLRHIAAAIHGVAPVPAETLIELSRRAGAGWMAAVSRVGSALAALDAPLVLVFDDLHAITNPASLDTLAELSRYVPEGSRLAIASREEPALPLARWRVQGCVDEIGVTDLRLDDHEAEQLLAAAGVELDADELSQLVERTEGWPAGLYLAALAMQAGAASPASAEAFDGDDRYVSEYFRLELLSRLPADDARFLQYTSVLDRMSAGLCDAVVETAGSARRLETLERTNSFVVPLDRTGAWYRYHHLFGQLLRTELERNEPDIVPALNRRAMTWCLANDLPEAAVVYGHEAGETETVAGLVEGLALTLEADGRRETLEEWLGWFSDDELVRYPALGVYAAWMQLLRGRTDEADRYVALVEGATSSIPLSDGSDTIEPSVANLRAYMMREGVERALADAELAVEQLPPGSGLMTYALTIRGTAYALLGADDRAAEDLADAIAAVPPGGDTSQIYVARAQLALLAARRGAWGEAALQAQAAQELLDELGRHEYMGSATTHVATARVALHEGRQADARTALAHAHRLRPLLTHGVPWLSIQVGVELARAHLALGEAGAARTVLTETERMLELRPQMGTLVDDVRDLHDRIAATSGSAGAWAMSLTGAELRLLPYLATHLTVPEIASRLFISRNTAKTEAVSIYRKLGAASRSQAIDRAVEVGLLDGSIFPPQHPLT